MARPDDPEGLVTGLANHLPDLSFNRFDSPHDFVPLVAAQHKIYVDLFPSRRRNDLLIDQFNGDIPREKGRVPVTCKELDSPPARSPCVSQSARR